MKANWSDNPSQLFCLNFITLCARKGDPSSERPCNVAAIGNGESFLAEVWFSTYKEGAGATPKLAAIIADVSEEQVAANGTTSLDQKERPSLSSRELDALRLVVQGLSNKEIASRMEISESAVKNTLQQLFGKAEVRTRSQLVRVALERYRDLI